MWERIGVGLEPKKAGPFRKSQLSIKLPDRNAVGTVWLPVKGVGVERDMLTPAPRVLPELGEGHGAILGVRCLSISLRVQQVTPDGIVAVLVGEGAVEDVYFFAVRMVVRPKDAIGVITYDRSDDASLLVSIEVGSLAPYRCTRAWLPVELARIDDDTLVETRNNRHQWYQE